MSKSKTNKLKTVSETLTMSSVEIANLCEKDHSYVLGIIRESLTELNKLQTVENPTSLLEESYRSKQGKALLMFRLNKNQSLWLVARLDTSCLTALILRILELEKIVALIKDKDFLKLENDFLKLENEARILRERNNRLKAENKAMEAYRWRKIGM